MPTPRIIRGRYEIRGVLGEGGMGVVYRAYDTSPLNREVALKTLLEFPDPMSLQLFYKECEVLKSMSHPNIVEIFDIGEFEDGGAKKPFFVMPLLVGKGLDALIKEASHRLTVERVVDIVSQTCRGLQAAHERGLVHRDLKPSNIFVMEDDSVRIIDFGVAHVVDSGTRSGSFQKGTLLYMAPEQIQFKPVSAQSDIFALGVVCYEALTRRQPFRGASAEEITTAILKTSPPPASEINPAINQRVSRVIHKAMAKQPWHRFETAREFADAMQKASRNEPIEIFDNERIRPRIDRASKALDSGDYQFAIEIVSELEAEGNVDSRLTVLRAQIDQAVRQRTISQLLESARARFEQEEDPLALQKTREVLEIDPNNVTALTLKSRIEERRSERQIEKWLRLAREHCNSHAYEYAREALQNVLQLRVNEPRALRLMADIEAQEKELLRIRQQKAQIYQEALNSWKNGEVSEALSQMELVLDLDRQMPELSSEDTIKAYQTFYTTVRSEHEAINDAYAKARRALAERDFPKAMEICREALAKYPSQALFQGLIVDVEVEQSQTSGFIAETSRHAEREPDLDKRAAILREAVLKYPGNQRFARALELISEKLKVVEAVVTNARRCDESGEFSEALLHWEELSNIYPAYPGLRLEIERIQMRREQQQRSEVRGGLATQISNKIRLGQFGEAMELLEQVKKQFPNDSGLEELEKIAQSGIERSIQADALLKKGTDLIASGIHQQGLNSLREAYALDQRNSEVRKELVVTLAQQALSKCEVDLGAAELLSKEALELDPSNPVARNAAKRIADQKRESLVEGCLSEARSLLAQNRPDQAVAALSRGLDLFPEDSRLRTLYRSVATLPPKNGEVVLSSGNLVDERKRELIREGDSAVVAGDLRSDLDGAGLTSFGEKEPPQGFLLHASSLEQSCSRVILNSSSQTLRAHLNFAKSI